MWGGADWQDDWPVDGPLASFKSLLRSLVLGWATAQICSHSARRFLPLTASGYANVLPYYHRGAKKKTKCFQGDSIVFSGVFTDRNDNAFRVGIRCPATTTVVNDGRTRTERTFRQGENRFVSSRVTFAHRRTGGVDYATFGRSEKRVRVSLPITRNDVFPEITRDAIAKYVYYIKFSTRVYWL